MSSDLRSMFVPQANTTRRAASATDDVAAERRCVRAKLSERRLTGTYDPAAHVDSRPTFDQYDSLQWAFDHLNDELFGGDLPPCLITLQRQGGAYGYFSRDKFRLISDARRSADEIALNPAHFATRDERETVATLVHEMVHLWQHQFGSPARRGFHNAEFADKLNSLGLLPTATGKPGGARTGDHLEQIIADDGEFAHSYERLCDAGWRLRWSDNPDPAWGRSAIADRDGTRIADWELLPDEQPRVQKSGRLKFTCALCGLNAWAKPSARLNCGDCRSEMSAG